MSSDEPLVHIKSDVPHGYKFVPKGNVYVTKNCRALTHQAGDTVYVVRDSKKRTRGIRVPTQVWKRVQKLDAETKEQREKAIKKKDSALEDKVKAELLKKFPRVPLERVQKIVEHMLKKRSRRVGRSKDINYQQMVELGVRAHMRHTETQYDELLRNGVDREEARRQVKQKMDEMLRSWMPPSSTATKSTKERKLAVRTNKEPASKLARRSSLRIRNEGESSNRIIAIAFDPMDID